MANNNGLVFFYDWRDAFEALSGDDCKKLLLAMVDYHQNATPPPQFEGGAKIAAAFIFPAIDRSKKLSEAGKNAQIKKRIKSECQGKENETSSHLQGSFEPPSSHLQGGSKPPSRTRQDKDKTETKEPVAKSKISSKHRHSQAESPVSNLPAKFP